MKTYSSYGDRIKPVELTCGVDLICGCIYGLVRSHTVLHGLVRSLIRLYTDVAPISVFLKFYKSYTAFTDTLEWPECNSPECNSDKATVGSVLCTVYTDGQPHKPCVLCETGVSHFFIGFLSNFIYGLLSSNSHSSLNMGFV